MSIDRFVYGPVPSRRMGLSLGVSPIPRGTCNHTCVYCQLGRTTHLTNIPGHFYPVEEILSEVEGWLDHHRRIDIITIVGEGEPTLYADLKALITGIQNLTDLPVAVITNGALLYEAEVADALEQADLVLPSIDAPDERLYRRINRPHGSLSFDRVIQGLRDFSRHYRGRLWIETMLLKGVNDSDDSLLRLRRLINTIDHDRLFINTPVRPPAETDVAEPSRERLEAALRILGGTAIDHLVSEGFASNIEDSLEAILSIIRRHPMNQFEIRQFLTDRGEVDPDSILDRLDHDQRVSSIDYKGYRTYR